MNRLNHWLSLLAFFMMATLSAQTITGTVIDEETKEPLLGANVLIKGTTHGISTNEKGKFSLTTTDKKGILQISFIGFQTKEVPYTLVGGKANIQVSLLPETEELTGVVVTGNALLNMAKERCTPVAVSTIGGAEIVNKLGNNEFPELLKRTPSVYATKSGGGYGDSKINIRGFGNENIAVMINGMPVNDMENGKVYWSNWAGIADVTSTMQVQRGLGASKLAIASVGGTINIATRAADMSEGGRISATYGNDGFYKGLAAYNTGKNKKGWSASVLLSRTGGATYADNTQFLGDNYFFALGYSPNDQHALQFMITGAPQWHNQRYYAISIRDYLRYGKDGEPNRRYNADWGYKNGESFSFNRNIYHKPVMMLNWDWKLSESSSFSTVAYASFGRGYGFDYLGNAKSPGSSYGNLSAGNFRTVEGLVDIDRLIRYNRGERISVPGQAVEDNPSPRVAKSNQGFSRKASINSHNWFGFLTNFDQKLSENLSFSVGLDGRYYKGYHYEAPSDLLGNEYFSDDSNKNLTQRRRVTYTVADKPSYNPFNTSIDPLEDQINYSNYGNVRWMGLFGQLEYTTEKLSAFAQWSSSVQAFQRIDNFLRPGTLALPGRPETAMDKETSYKGIPGYNIKAGANYNINNHHNVFANVGYYSRQPFFNAVYPNYKNFLASDLINEKIFGVELGYGFKMDNFAVNLNLYRTTWNDRHIQTKNQWDSRNTKYFAELFGIKEIHQGVELDASYRVNDYLKFVGMFSAGDWTYQGKSQVYTFLSANNQEYILPGKTTSSFDVDLSKLKVGESAHMTANLGVDITPFENFNIDLSWHYVDNLYAKLDIAALVQNPNLTSLKLPAYHLFDGGISYKYPFGKTQSITLLANVNNLLDTTYIAESDTNNLVNGNTTATYKGIDVSNRVFFGFGRTWNVGLKYQF